LPTFLTYKVAGFYCPPKEFLGYAQFHRKLMSKKVTES